MNVVVTNAGKYVKVEFNDYAAAVNSSVAFFLKASILWVNTTIGDSIVEVLTATGDKYQISYDGNNSTLKIDSVDGVTITDNIQLYNEIINLLNT